jgi:hypothetical protein
MVGQLQFYQTSAWQSNSAADSYIICGPYTNSTAPPKPQFIAILLPSTLVGQYSTLGDAVNGCQLNYNTLGS